MHFIVSKMKGEFGMFGTCVGKLVAAYCPSVSGCRAVVEFKDVTDMQTIDITDDELRMAFNSSQHAAVWLVGTLTSFATATHCHQCVCLSVLGTVYL